MNRMIARLAWLFAVLGGLVLTALIVLTCLSVIGRSINSVLHGDFFQGAMSGTAEFVLSLGVGPINGDFEIVEAGMAFAIFAFLPICQLHAAHASVDIFTSRMPIRFNVILRAVIEVIFATVLIIFAWQLTLGGMSKFRSGQTTLLLEFPVWWSYAASIAACWAAALVGVYVAWVRIGETAGRPTGTLTEDGASH